MTEYKYERQTFDRSNETVEMPDGAVGITVGSFGDLGTVDYLVPVEELQLDELPDRLEYVECDDCGVEALPARKKGMQATRGFQCENCGKMY